MITSLFNKILNAWKCNERLLTLLKPRSRHFLVIICWLGGVYIGHPPNVYGLEFQADGWLMLQNDREEDFVKTNLPSARFSVGCKVDGWQIQLGWRDGIKSWLSYDGQSYYRLTIMPGASHASAGTVSLKPDPSLPEFEKILLFVFALRPDLVSDLAGQKPVPFLGGLDPASSIYAWNLTRSKLSPSIPITGSFPVSESLLKSVVAGLSAAGNVQKMLYVSNVYSADLPPAGYQLVASHKTEDVELPLRFEFIHPYRKNGVLQERRFKGEVTNFVEKGLNSVLPPLETSTFVQDVRLGKAFLYQATNRSWLSAEDAATVGKRLVAAPSAPPGKWERSSGSMTRLIRGILVLLFLAPLCFFILKWRKWKPKQQTNNEQRTN